LATLESRSTFRSNPNCRVPSFLEQGAWALPRWAMTLACVSAVILGPAAAVHAHEAGTTRVVASFTPDRRYAIELTTDASTLLARLEAARKQPRSSPATVADYRRGFAALCDEVGRHLAASFDGAPAPVSPSCVVDDEVTGSDPAVASLGVTIRFSGQIPVGAARFTWQYGLTSTAYALTIVSSDGSADPAQWLEGEQISPAALLDRVAAPGARARAAVRLFRRGFTRFLPNGPGQILFVLGIILLNRRFTAVLWQVGAFTLAYSIVLALMPDRLMSLSPSLVDALIVVSVIYVAFDNLLSARLKVARVGLIFAAGLIHGVAFAHAVRQFALPGAPSVADLFWFNAGIGTGQLALILGACAVAGEWASQRERYRRMVAVPASAVIVLTGLLWMLLPIAP
jgi:hypothetical protein